VTTSVDRCTRHSNEPTALPFGEDFDTTEVIDAAAIGSSLNQAKTASVDLPSSACTVCLERSGSIGGAGLQPRQGRVIGHEPAPKHVCVEHRENLPDLHQHAFGATQ
jgi:hypothetical protein